MWVNAVLIVCDEGNCERTFLSLSPTLLSARKDIEESNWEYKRSKHYCPIHKK